MRAASETPGSLSMVGTQRIGERQLLTVRAELSKLGSVAFQL